MSDNNRIKVLFGTMTGNAEELANDLAEKLNQAGFTTTVEDVCDYPVANLREESQIALVISTWGEGDPPDEAEDFCFDLYDGKAGELPNLSFAICGLGDSSYDDFCGCARKVEEALVKAGATKITDRAELDVDFEDGYEAWCQKFIAALGK